MKLRIGFKIIQTTAGRVLFNEVVMEAADTSMMY
jgi:hypothetical protein